MNHKQTINNPSGGKPRQRLWAFWKENVVFAMAKLLIYSRKKWLKFPGNFQWIFAQLLQLTGNLVCQTRAVFSSFHMAMPFCKERPVISKRFSALEFIQRHCQTLMLRISFGFTWLLTLVARLHGMACTKYTRFGPLLEVVMSKKCTLLWRAARFQVKMLKTPGVRTTFGHQIFRFAKMILRDRCSTLYDLASLFVADAVL